MLYEMAALKPAFDAYNLISLFYKIVKGEFKVSYVKHMSTRQIQESVNTKLVIHAVVLL